VMIIASMTGFFSFIRSQYYSAKPKRERGNGSEGGPDRRGAEAAANSGRRAQLWPIESSPMVCHKLGLMYIVAVQS
jgi:hypothetical protein